MESMDDLTKEIEDAPAAHTDDENPDDLVGEEVEDDLDLDLDSFEEIDVDLEEEDD